MAVRGSRMGWGVGRFVLAALFVVAGVLHFATTDVYLRIMPPYLPWHRALVLLSGAAEVALGALLLIPAMARLAAWGLIALLIAVFPANVFMAQHPERFGIPVPVLLLRLPLQGLLIFWAWRYTRPGGRSRSDRSDPREKTTDLAG